MILPFQPQSTATRRMSVSSLGRSLLCLSLLALSSVVVVAQKAAAAGVGGKNNVVQPPPPPPPPPILETRDTFVPYPATALTMLLEEIEDIGAPLGLEVVTSMAPPVNPADSSYEVWQLLKGMVHRFRNQNQIIHANPHYYITNGFDLGCRAIQVDVDTNRQVEIQVKPIPPQCHGACTNHGRYCVVSNENLEEADNSKGAMLVEETLRRLCFVEIYHGSDLRFWEYMEAFERLQCAHVTGAGTLMSSCAERAVKQVPRIDYAPLENCMHLAGGLKDDVINVRLKEEMDKQVKGRFPYTMKDLPLIRVAAKKFSGPRNVPSIFRFACSVYQEKTGISPIACDFCADCLGVKQCLWELTCNGVPFDTTTFQQQQQLMHSPTSAPTTTDSVEALPSGLNTTTLTPPPPSSPSSATTPITPFNSTITSTPTAATTTSPPSASPSQEEEPEFVPFEHQTVEPSPSVPSPSTNSNNNISSAASSSATETEEEDSSNDYTSNDGEYDNDDDYYHSPFVVYGVPVLVAVGLLAIYAIVSRCIRHHHDQHKMSSAEEYVNDLMNESYRDNMAVSGRIEDEASDRSMEDVSIEEHNFGAPPFASFKVHMVMA